MILSPELLDEFSKRVFSHIDLAQDTLNSFLKLVYRKKYPRKTYLLDVGDSWNTLFYIHRGLIRLFYIDVEGREFNKSFFWEGHWIWPVAPKDRNQGVLFSIAAVEDTTMIECRFEYLHDFLQQSGQWEKFALPVAETLIEQKFQREHDFLRLSAAERFKKFSDTYPAIVHRIPDYHLASYLGITNVSLSRIKRIANF